MSRFPRRVSRACAAVLLLGVLALAVPGATGAAAARAPERDGPARRVLLVSMPRLTWADVAEHRPPALVSLLRRSAVASLSTRTIGPQTTAGEGYATVGAGSRTAVPEFDSGFALQADERFEGDTAAAVYERRTGVRATRAVVQLNIAPIVELNDDLLYGSRPGAFGSALTAAGRSAAVIANADGSEDLDLPIIPSFPGGGGRLPLHREAALAVMDSGGQTEGVVSRSVTEKHAQSPFGIRLAEDRVVAAFRDAWARHDVVLVENSDLERADSYAAFSAPKPRKRARAVAIEQGDRILGHVLREVDLSRDAVVLFAPAGPRQREQLTVVAVAGPGVEPGVARSGTTRRGGYATLTDIAPTVLGALDVPIPDSMTGTAISSNGGSPISVDRLERFVRSNEVALFRDSATGPVTATFIVFQVLVYAAASVALFLRSRRGQRVVGHLALVVLAVPPVAFVSGLFPYDALGVPGYMASLAVGAVAVGAVAVVAGRGHRVRVPAIIVAFTLALLLVDLFTGARMQINTVFGYSPIVAGRFAGYGNLASALVAICAIVVVTAAWALPDVARIASRVRVAAAGGLLVVTLAIVGHPSLGSDVGGVLTLVPASAAVLLLLAGAPLGWRRIVVIGLVTVAAVAVFAAIDLSRPPELRTHLGRLVARAFGSSGADLLTVVERKASANISILTSSAWTYVIPVAFAFLTFLVWRRPEGLLQRLQERTPGLRPCLVGALVAAVLGFTLNDSGVAIPAMMLAVLLPYLTFLLVRTPDIDEAGPADAPRTT